MTRPGRIFIFIPNTVLNRLKIHSLFSGHMQQDSWIGLELNTGSGAYTYTWVDSGKDVELDNWGNEAQKINKCVYAKQDSGEWIDQPCSQRHTFVCKTNESKSS